MRKLLSVLLLIFSVSTLLIACGSDDQEIQKDKDVAAETDSSKEEVEKNDEPEPDDSNEAGDDLTLPAEFPTDFPFPDGTEFTDIDADSEDVQFIFDTEIDLDATFEMYNEYAESKGYNIIIGAEAIFADNIFQMATDLTADESFLVTLKPDEGTYGSVKVKTQE